MIERVSGFAVVLTALVITSVLAVGATPAGVAASTGGANAEVPITINSTFTGTDLDRNHAVRVTITLTPDRQSGAINNSVVTIRPTENAFIDLPSISTSETAGGDQVVSRTRERPARFRIAQLDPGESVTISFRLYPKAVVPDGERLVAVDIETQFVRDSRIETATRGVAPTVEPDELRFTTDPPVPIELAGGLGTVAGGLLVGAIAFAHHRRLRTGLIRCLRDGRNTVVNSHTERRIDQALSRLGASPDEDRRGRAHEDSAPAVPSDRHHDSGSDSASADEDDGAGTVVIDFDD